MTKSGYVILLQDGLSNSKGFASSETINTEIHTYNMLLKNLQKF